MTEGYDLAKAEQDYLDLLDRNGKLFNRDRVQRELAAIRRQQSAFLRAACALPLASRAKACAPQAA